MHRIRFEKGYIMINTITFLAAVSDNVVLTGCVEDSDDSRLSGSRDAFARITGSCLSQASCLTGVRSDRVRVLERILTGGAPVLTLDAAGAQCTCREETDGSVAVFSEFSK